MKNRIKSLREEKHMTQVGLSIEMEVAQETVSAYEIGKHCPSISSLLKMADIFDASLDYIMGLSDIRKPIKEEHLPNDEISMLILFRKLNVNQKEKAIAYMQGLNESK